MLLTTVVALVLAVAGAPLSFRLSGWMLAAVCAAGGVLRLLPDPWWATVRNRGRGFDATVFFGVAAALSLFTASIPV